MEGLIGKLVNKSKKAANTLEWEGKERYFEKSYYPLVVVVLQPRVIVKASGGGSAYHSSKRRGESPRGGRASTNRRACKLIKGGPTIAGNDPLSKLDIS